MNKIYQKTIKDLLIDLGSAKIGLTSQEAKVRLEKYGANVLPQAGEKVTRLKIFLEQWKSPLLIILIIAGIISGFLEEFIDMTVIFIAAGVNGIIGFLQEDKANKALSKLREMVEYKAVVIRSGQKKQIASTEIVPGDILLLEAGDKIQADGRILEAVDLEINEAVLTGESEAVKKNTQIIKKVVPLGDRQNMVFRGTVTVNGRATILVTATGKETEIGKIAVLVKQTTDDSTPLQKQLKHLAKVMSWVIMSLSLFLFFLGVFSPYEHHGILQMFETAVAVAVAAIPEGLVVTLTIILAVGMQHILKRRALVRKLLAAETLGSVSVICTDKTGTLTEGKMRVTKLITANDDLNFAEISVLTLAEKHRHLDAYLALHIGMLCNNAVLVNAEKTEKDWQLIGDTTDTALLYAGSKAHLNKVSLEETMPRLAELSFDSNKKFMATKHYIDSQVEIYVKGAPEVLLKKSNFYEDKGKIKKMTAKQRAWFKEQVKEMTASGLRVLALGFKKTEDNKKELKLTDINDLILVGLVALSDPLRADVKETIKLARGAGIRVVMITGDHKHTAQAIGKKIGLAVNDEQIIEGPELEVMNEAELQIAIKNTYIFARVDPKHKISIVKAFQANGEVVAMTGDGINDAPALKGADIGVALGSGTDVAKETSDIVLLDNNFKNIVEAVEEGRGIYENIKKVVVYLLSGSFAEIILIGGSVIFALPLPVLAVQILWVNLIEDSFPNIALAFEKSDRGLMQQPPRRLGEKLLDKEMKLMIIAKSILANLVLIVIFLYLYWTGTDLALIRTMMFIGLAIDSLFAIFAFRNLHLPIYRYSFWSNKYVIATVIFGWLMLLAGIYLPALQVLLRTVALDWHHWLWMIGFGVYNLIIIEIIKKIFLIKNNHKKYA